MESQLQNPEFRNNPENFHPCIPSFSGIDINENYYIHGMKQICP